MPTVSCSTVFNRSVRFHVLFTLHMRMRFEHMLYSTHVVKLHSAYASYSVACIT